MTMHSEHLSKDKKLYKIMMLQASFELDKKNNVYLQLCASIISQQLSTKVAQIIYKRFLDLFDTNTPKPEEILELPFEQLRSIGLSNSKTHYLRNVCEFFIAEKLTDAKLLKLTSEEVLDKLIQIKGVGRWTVEMLLMFTLGYEDVFAVDDLGIQQAMTKLYNLDPADKKKMKADMLRISAKWSPYRTYACRYLWGWKDTPK
jgi:DNA-3-methyladenine glycosylase II